MHRDGSTGSRFRGLPSLVMRVSSDPSLVTELPPDVIVVVVVKTVCDSEDVPHIYRVIIEKEII